MRLPNDLLKSMRLATPTATLVLTMVLPGHSGEPPVPVDKPSPVNVPPKERDPLAVCDEQLKISPLKEEERAQLSTLVDLYGDKDLQVRRDASRKIRALGMRVYRALIEMEKEQGVSDARKKALKELQSTLVFYMDGCADCGRG